MADSTTLEERQLIFDSGRLSGFKSIVHFIGGGFLLLISLATFSLPAFAIAQNGLSLGLVVAVPLILVIAICFFAVAISVLSPLFFGYTTRIYADRDKLEVVTAFPFQLIKQTILRDQVNRIEIFKPRKGGYQISVLYLFGKEGPSLKSMETIGPFYSPAIAQGVANAIQQHLIATNLDWKQIEQHEQWQRKIATRFAAIFLLAVLSFVIVASLF